MPGPTGPLAAVPAGLWVATGTQLQLLDPSSGAARVTVHFMGRIRLLVTDPSGRRLYVTTDEPVRNDETPLVELDAGTGAILIRSWEGYADLRGPSGLAPTDDGVWITQPTGMMASLRLLRASDLGQAAVFRPGGSNGLTASVAAGRLWVTDVRGGYECADASTGRVLGHVGKKSGVSGGSNVVAVPSGLYVGGYRGLERIVPEPSCGVG
jgi:hypothetical protein